ncbi:hypothetical protein BVG16_24305 [Paenibacillus selenitireducens]|uniref:Uncharacterized protein n=1 Tax=Paenibacillus selenitireducens TaxID=1324314 RepID=A0A1T2X3V0_9BACL|nr:DUF523 domain-containing protein [Paenibacillus selenitireducens]OPA74253.1 hypothetical protein BVG16_24305 [Paenibacillus selenitireducens]
MIIVSSCLGGIECRYNGTHRLVERIQQLVEDGQAMMVCPELMGGFTTPREPAEIVGGTGEDVLGGTARIIDKSGTDVTELYLKGANLTLELARQVEATYIVLKENSPSCGSQMIYNGTFSNQRIPGEGVTSALLKREGFKVISENEFIAMV